MKMRITRKELSELTSDQRRNLTDRWIPQIYDVAVASICKDAEEEEFDEMEFVVGKIEIFHGSHIYLTDLRAVIDDNVQHPEENEELNIQTDPVFGSRTETQADSSSLGRAVDNLKEPFDDVEQSEGASDEDYDEDVRDGYAEDEAKWDYERPTMFNKEECVPLLNIGQMIDMLQRNNFGKYDFYLTASTYEIGCELGNNNADWENNHDYEPKELCEVLWESVKALL